MDARSWLQSNLPPAWWQAWESIPPSERERVQELRLRAGEPMRVSLPEGERIVTPFGLSCLRQPGVLRCTAEEIRRVLMTACEESLYAHEAELSQGFVMTAAGIRIGVSGTGVAEKGGIRTLRDVTGLCLRLPRRHRGCAKPLLPVLSDAAGLHSTLLVGEPASGKTTLLRDLAERSSALGYRVSVVDERGELNGDGWLSGCDVLRGCPKGDGVLMALRTLAPDVIFFDELGTLPEVEAVAACAHAGVAVVSTLHGAGNAVLKRPVAKRLLQGDCFSRWVFLAGRQTPGEVERICPGEVLRDEDPWDVAGGAGGTGTGDVLCCPSFPAGEGAL